LTASTMRRVELMRKGLVLSTLLVILTLLATVSMAGGKGPKPPTPSDWRVVTFSGDITGGGVLVADSRGGFRLYTSPNERTPLTFEGSEGDLWHNGTYDFLGLHDDGVLLIRIEKNSWETDIVYSFGQQPIPGSENTYWKWELKGRGIYDPVDGFNEGTVIVDGEEFVINELYLARTGHPKKSALEVEGVEVWKKPLSFDITIQP